MQAVDTNQTTMTRWQILRRPRSLAILAAACLVGGGGWTLWARPQRRTNQMRYESTLDIAKLYGLQLSYKKEHGVYANDLDSLLSASPDREALKANLAANTDMNTLAVVGDAKRFKVELNVLDAERTPIRVRGPISPRRAATPAPTMTEAPAQMNADGAPVAPGR